MQLTQCHRRVELCGSPAQMTMSNLDQPAKALLVRVQLDNKSDLGNEALDSRIRPSVVFLRPYGLSVRVETVLLLASSRV